MSTRVRDLPLRLQIAAGESVDSWIEALGRRYRLPPLPLAAALGLPTHYPYIARLLRGTAPAAWRRAERAAGLEPGRLTPASTLQSVPGGQLSSGGSRFVLDAWPRAADAGRSPGARRGLWPALATGCCWPTAARPAVARSGSSCPEG